MAQLKDLSLTSIEQAGADTREVLEEVKEVLPSRIWSRHPILKITGTTLVDTDEDEEVFERSVEITIEYTGVYHLKIKYDLKHLADFDKKKLIDFLSRHTELLPHESEETYERLDELLSIQEKEIVVSR